jgi:hypothetical protein
MQTLARWRVGQTPPRSRPSSRCGGDFKKTREGGIIPAIYAGKTADAKALVTGIKAERTKTLKAGMGCN